MTTLPVRSVFASLVVTVGFCHGPVAAQEKMTVKVVDGKVQTSSDRPDEFKAMVGQVQEAYKAPFEVDKDIRDELRKQYQNPTPEREQKILREVRRLYVTSPEQEERIVQEMRRAYEVQSPDQEGRLFAEIGRLGKVPPGTVPMSVQTAQAEKFFQRLDANRDGVLGENELPDALAANFAKWDRNRDGSIEAREYWVYYQASLKTVSEKVASGEIAIKLPGGATLPKPPAAEPEEYRLQVFRAGKLPEGLPGWFEQLDENYDGQVGLYEWRTAGRDLDAFAVMDQNGDDLLTPDECLKWVKMSAVEREKAEAAVRSAPRVGVPDRKTGSVASQAAAKLEKVVEKRGPGGEPVLVVKTPKGGDAPPKGEAKDKGERKK